MKTEKQMMWEESKLNKMSLEQVCHAEFQIISIHASPSKVTRKSPLKCGLHIVTSKEHRMEEGWGVTVQWRHLTDMASALGRSESA